MLLGVINIDLRNKLPWNGEDYVPPRQHKTMSEAAAAKDVCEYGNMGIWEFGVMGLCRVRVVLDAQS